MNEGIVNGRSAFVPRKAAPTKALGHHNLTLSYRIWARSPYYDEDVKPWKCVAAFMFLRDALDYIASLQDAGVSCVFQSPADCRSYLPSDQRAVYKAPDACVGAFEGS
jgi:hypothetical protein